MNADAKPNTKLKLLNADEISTAVYHRAGLKVEPHDVSIRDMLIMQAMFATVMENIQKQQIAQFQHDIAHFQAALTETATPIIEASEELQELKAEIIKEILASNENEIVQALARSRSRQQCPSINEKAVSGTLTFGHRAAAELDNLLARKINRKHKGCTIN